MSPSVPLYKPSPFLLAHSELLCMSYQALTGKALLSVPPDQSLAEALYMADMPVLSHNTATDPIFNYANAAAQTLFGYDWSDFVRLPSRLSAESILRAQREQLLQRVARDGFVDDYSGIRIARDGRRFEIRRATVWNLHDAAGEYQGQAACLHEWHPL